MYHRVAVDETAPLTVSVAQLEAQLRWLRAQGFAPISVADVVAAAEHQRALPAQSFLVTFDDGYVDTFELAQPVLQRLGLRAAVFVPGAFVGGTSAWDRDAQPLMDAGQLRALAAEGWEIGLHSHTHRNFRTLTAAAIAADVRENFSTLRSLGLVPVSALAYPYGGRPRAAPDRAAMQTALREAGVRLAFRIGNRVNALPLRAPFEINRLGVRGDRSFAAFQRQIRWGRLL